MISSRTYTALARRDLEIAPTNVGASVRLETAPTVWGATEISSPPHGDYVKSFATENTTNTRRNPLT